MNASILEQLIVLWRKPPTDQENAAQDYTRDHTLTAKEIHSNLLRDFSEDEIVDQAVQFFEEMVAIHQRHAAPNRRDIYLLECLLVLSTEEGGIQLPLATTQKIVKVIPLSIWYRLIKKLVAKKLTRSELLAAFLEGISQKEPRDVLENCLAGIGMYQKLTQREADPADSVRLVEQLRPLVTQLKEDNRRDISMFAKKAETQLQSYL